MGAFFRRPSMAIKQIRLRSLSPQWQELVKRMQRVNFGYLKWLRVVDGEPERFGDEFEIVTKYKFPGENVPRSEAYLDDFVLPAEVVDFIGTLQDLYIARIPIIHIRHGLPVQMEIEEME